MPLFRHSPTPPPEPRKRTIFSSSRTTDKPTTTAPANRATPPAGDGTTGSSRRFFRRRSTGSSSDMDPSTHRNRRGSVGSGSGTSAALPRTGSLFGRVQGRDRSLDAARAKVTLAEKAEKEADAALAAAKKAVVEARRHVQILEGEANEQARLAHEKVLGVRSLKNDASGLGRHMAR